MGVGTCGPQKRIVLSSSSRELQGVVSSAYESMASVVFRFESSAALIFSSYECESIFWPKMDAVIL
jgi:hypothetical protein